MVFLSVWDQRKWEKTQLASTPFPLEKKLQTNPKSDFFPPMTGGGMPVRGGVPARFSLLHPQKPCAAPAPGQWFGGGRGDVPARGHGMGGTHGCISWGNFQTQHPREEWLLLLCAPSLPAPSRAMSHLLVTAPSHPDPVTYWQGNWCQKPQDILELRKQS